MRHFRSFMRTWRVGLPLCALILASGCSSLFTGEDAPSASPSPKPAATYTPALPRPALPSATFLPTALPSPAMSTSAAPPPTSTFSPSPWSAAYTFGAWEQVLSVGWSSDSRLLAASAGEKIYLFENLLSAPLQVLQTDSWAERLTFSPAQNQDSPYLLAAVVKDGSVQLWDARTGEKLAAWGAHQKGAKSAAFNPQGTQLATTGGDAMVRLWDLQTLTVESTGIPALQAEMIGGAYTIPDARFSPDGSLIASVDIHDIRLRDPATQRLVRTLSGTTSIFRIAFNPDGSQLAAAEMGNQVSLWEVASGEKLAVWTAAEPQENNEKIFLWDLVFSPDGRWLAAAGSDGMITLWEMSTGQVTNRFSAHARAATSLAFSPDSKQLATGGLDCTLKIWDITDLPRFP